jgi:glutamyl-tRNA reductase
MTRPEIFVIGATHHTTPLAVRERLALDTESEAALHAELASKPGVRELTVLNTCNRVEFYGVADGPAAIEGLEASYCARQRFDHGEFQRFRVGHRGKDAVLHLFEVAAGLDSQIVGETEILGQVKDAYAAGQARGSTGPILNRLFQKAFQAAKHVRTHTGIGAGQVSVANVAVELALNIFGSLDSRHILLLGAGDIGERTARAFKSRGAARLTVASRRTERAEALAADLGAASLPFEGREAGLVDFDVVVSSVAAPDTVWSSAAAAAAMRTRPARPLFFIDLGVPRNVDPGVTDLENVFLYNLDDLAKVAEDNRLARESEVKTCRAILEERADALWQHLGARLGHGQAGLGTAVSQAAPTASPPQSHPPAGREESATPGTAPRT